MPNWFTFKTSDELLAKARELGLSEDIGFESDISVLMQPVKIGGRTVGNRLAIHPMEGCDGEPDGQPGELTVRRWERFGDGGCKLIWGEAVAVLEEARANPRQLWIHPGSLKSTAAMVERLRQKHREAWGACACEDLLVGCQLTHSGRYSYRKPLIAMRDPVVDPITMVAEQELARLSSRHTDGANTSVAPGKVPIPADYPVLSDDDLKRIEDAFIVAAKLAVQAGFDFLDLKQCHRYLLSELLGCHTRPGPYGGSLENRTRLVRNIIGRIRSEVSKDVLIATRMNMADFVPYMQAPAGTEAGATGVGVPRPYTTPYLWAFGVKRDDPLTPDLSEPRQVIAMLRDLGVCLFNLSIANPYNNPHFGRPFERPPVDGYDTPEHPLIGCARMFRLAGQLQQAFPDVPMLGTGYSWLQNFLVNVAAANVKQGKITLAGVGRGAFAYPDFVKDLRDHGRMLKEKTCIADSCCTALMRSKGNEVGQYASGCVPRDKVYVPIYKEAITRYRAGNKPPEK
ncbi:MAG TPA: NADH:flavin oxidoreductase [Planctomycetota bacterium]